MAAPTVYQDVAEGVRLEGVGQLFAGKKFWVAIRVPSRNRLIDDIKANGGEVVPLEKKADYLIADHLRRDCPPGSLSYEFVDQSLRDGALRDPAEHRAGPPLGEAREPGSISRPAKVGRRPYTADEDRILYKWVRDAEGLGGSASGNEMYKQLEAQYPQHTWQSWRDHYLKVLRTRPPSAFNVPDNAPPSPPSDQPNERALQGTSPKAEKVQTANEASASDATRVAEEYTVDELANLFTSDDWEQLYAFVDHINAVTDEDRYKKGWVAWAEDREKQTAEQWRQYYEKVIRPQWLRDPESKRDQIRKKLVDKDAGSAAAHIQIFSQQEGDTAVQETTESSEVNVSEQEAAVARNISVSEDEDFEKLLTLQSADQKTGYVVYAREHKCRTWNAQPGLKHTELHEILLARWDALSDDARTPYLTSNEADGRPSHHQAVRIPADAKLLSSSTALPESPKYLTEMYKKAMKRARGEDIEAASYHHSESFRPSKRLRSTSMTPMPVESQQANITGTQGQPLEISSAESASSTSQSESQVELSQRLTMEDAIQSELGTQINSSQQDAHQAQLPTESIEFNEFPIVDRLQVPPAEEDEDSNSLPSNTPTPRATKQRSSNLDKQAILSSPTQDLPHPFKSRQDLLRERLLEGSVSPARVPDSDSTTQSLQEFRRSLNEEDMAQLPYTDVQHALQAGSQSPAPSSTSSSGSGDPDVPLEADEIDEFFEEQHEEGFDDDYIVKALKRTRCRPGLAIQVLEAWGKGKPLPAARGIWSIEDDIAVESGDGLALAKLEHKHTLDGWGGITERLVFLEAHRSR
ncbi:hypothetical protein ACN47E_000666 [Coniothyrium glycines]